MDSFSILCGLLLVLPFALRYAMSPTGRAQLSKTIWLTGISGTFLVLCSQIANAAGLLGQPRSAPLYLGIVWMIFLAALMYARLVISLRDSTDKGEKTS